MENLYFYRYRFTYQIRRTTKLPGYEGTTLWGVLGQSLMRTNRKAYNCLLDGETIDNKPLPTNYKAQPLIVEPPIEKRLIYHTGDSYYFDAVVVGNANTWLNELIAAADRINQFDIGTLKGRWTLTNIEKHTTNGKLAPLLGVHQAEKLSPKPPALKGAACALTDLTTSETQHLATSEGLGNVKAELLFTTPVSFKNMAQGFDMNFDNVATLLLARLQHLAYYFCVSKNKPESKQALQKCPTTLDEIKMRYWLTPHQISHYSNRSRKYKQIDALIGKLQYSNLPVEYLPLLQTGSCLHIGSFTSAGLGRYEVKISTQP